MALFFRADGLGWDHGRFHRMAGLFHDRGMRLNAAAIPVVCRQAGLGLEDFSGTVQVHSHGLAHLDHEPEGTSSEFGAARREEEVRRDLRLARELLEREFGPLYFAAFVPPWNSICDDFLPLLPAAGYRLLSREGRARAGVPGLAEANADLDLPGLRRCCGGCAEAAAGALNALAAGRAAVVTLRHARMTEEDFAFLERLLDLLAARGLRTAFLSEWARA